MQTAYNSSLSAAKAGLLADMGPKDIVTKTHASLKVLFGHLIALGADNELGKVPALATDVTANAVGFVVADQSQEFINDSSDPGAPAGKQFGVLKKGRIWCPCEDVGNFSHGGAVNIRYAGTGNKGAVRCAAVSMETAVLPSAKILAVDGNFALVELNLV